MSVAMLQSESSHSAELQGISREIRTGMTVICQDGAIGWVAGLAPVWAAEATHVLVQTGSVVPQEIAIPLKWVGQVTPKQVLLHVRRRHVQRVRPRVTDELLRADVREALYNTPTFRTEDALLQIDIEAHDQVVTLRGNVRTIWRALLAEMIARRVPGVWAVHNYLIGDDELEDGVRQALRAERRLNRPTFSVQVQLGHVTLRGQVQTAGEAALAVLAARRVPGVRALSNELGVLQASNPMPARLINRHALLGMQRGVGAGAG